MIELFNVHSRTQRIVSASCAVAAACLVAAAASGCHGGASSSPDNSSPESIQPTISGVDGSTVAIVNNTPITDDQLYDALQHYVPYQLPGFPQNPMVAQPAGKVALQNLILNLLTLQLARDNGVPVDQAGLDASYRDNKMLQEAQVTIPFETLLEQQGYSVEQYEHEVLAPTVADTNLLAKTVTITPPELQASYEANTKVYTIPASVHFHRIACVTLTQAKTVYNGIKGGAPMSEYASQSIAADDAGGNPDDPTDMARWINIEQPDRDLAAACKLISQSKAGDLLPPTQVAGQWWVIQVIQIRPREIIPYDQVKDLVRMNVVRQKAGQGGAEQLQTALAEYVQRASIKIIPLQYQSLVAQLQGAAIASGAPMPVAARPGPNPPPPPAASAP